MTFRPFRFGELEPRSWAADVYVIGGGDSLAGRDLKNVSRLGTTIGCNRAGFVADTDVVFSLDRNWARRADQHIAHALQHGQRVIIAMPPNTTTRTAPEIPGVLYLIRRRGPTLSRDRRDIVGTNSGYGALNLAAIGGAKRIHLLGFDMQSGEQRHHFHGGYGWSSASTGQLMTQWATEFGHAALDLKEQGIEVINYVGEPKSLIRCFPTAPIGDLAPLMESAA